MDLTGSRMIEEEAHQEWGFIFQDALGNLADEVTGIPSTTGLSFQLPNNEVSSGQFKWDPFHTQQSPVRDKRISVKMIDWFTRAKLSISDGKIPPQIRNLPSLVVPPTPTVRGYKPPHIWNVAKGAVWKSDREAAMISALLYLDSRLETSKDLLSRAFPSSLDARYPAMFLDENFLRRTDISIDKALKVISASISLVPPTLLESLTRSALDVLSTSSESPKLAVKEFVALELLKLLMKSDRPALALPLIMNTILQRPDASSWHRQLLTPGLLRRLSTNEVFQLVSDLSYEMLDTLKKRKQGQDREKSTTGTHLKVTTIKLLAQLLQDARLIAPSLAIDVLSKLIRNGNHTDIRKPTLKSMLQLLCDCKEESHKTLAETVMKNLESLRDIIGAFNGRNPTTEDEWKVAETKLELPEPLNSNEQPSLMINLFEVPEKLKKMSSVVTPQEFFTRILLPLVEHSREQNGRWMRLFCRKHGLEDNISDIPIAPADPAILKPLFLKHLADLDASWLIYLHKSYMFNISPPLAFQAINAKLSTDPTLKYGPDRHWSRHYNRRAFFSPIILVSRSELRDKRPDGITLTAVQATVLEEARTILTDSNLTCRVWKDFDNHMEPRYLYSDPNQIERWSRQIRPVLEHIILFIDELNTLTADQYPQLRRRFLPSTFSLRLSLLVLNETSTEGRTMEDRCERFANELRDFIRDAVIDTNGSPYHKRFEQLREHVAENTASKLEYSCRVAGYLGRSADIASLALEDYLCIEIAGTLLERSHPAPGFYMTSEPQAKWLDSVRHMVREWFDSENDYIQAFGERWFQRKEKVI